MDRSCDPPNFPRYYLNYQFIYLYSLNGGRESTVLELHSVVVIIYANLLG